MNKLWVGTDANVKNSMKVNKVKLGDKWTLSGNGDAFGNDDWLRLLDKDGKNYHGGFAANKVWVGRDLDVGQNMNVKANTTTNSLNASTLRVTNGATANTLNVTNGATANTLRVTNGVTANTLNVTNGATANTLNVTNGVTANTLRVTNGATANTFNANRVGVANKYFFSDGGANGMLKVTANDGRTLSKLHVGTATASNALCIQNVCITKEDLTRMKNMQTTST
jgi:hypothetical protein